MSYSTNAPRHPRQEPACAFGAALRQAREIRGNSLPDVAAVLRIKVVYLDALERGDYGIIPSGPFAVGFARSYARYLDVDEAGLAAVQRVPAAIDPGRACGRQPSGAGRRLAAGPLVALSVVIAAGLYGGWFLSASGGGTHSSALKADLTAMLLAGEDVYRPTPLPLAPGAEATIGELALIAPEGLVTPEELTSKERTGSAMEVRAAEAETQE